MLIEFKIKNFGSFRDEAVLSMIPATQDKEHLGAIWEGNRYRALKSVAIFGPNASGKTTILEALQVFCRFVLQSATRMTLDDAIPGINPFLLSKEAATAVSRFEVLIEINGEGYRYGIEVTKDLVHGEFLEFQDAAPKSRWIKLIQRERGGATVLHDSLGSPARRKQIIDDTRPNALILSRAAERNVGPIEPLFRWFKNRVRFVRVGSDALPESIQLRHFAKRAASDARLREQMAGLLRDADTGICGLEIEERKHQYPELSDDIPPALREALSSFRQALMTTTKDDNHSFHEFIALHKASGMDPVRFSLDNESAGTQRFWLYAGKLLEACASGSLLAVDELNESLHPQLVQRLIQLAHSPAFGDRGSQLVFTTHDLSLMEPGLLRRDQIFLTQKDGDGASELFSLWDIEDTPRRTAAWQRNYMAGRYGAAPVFGPALVDIPQADTPTPVADGLEMQSLEA